MMETIGYFTDFLRKIGTPNYLAVGIIIIVIWLLISGIRKGLKRRGPDQDSGENEQGE